MTVIDPSLWITWYDLAPEDTEAYLTWLHESYLPKLLRQTGIVNAAHYASVKKAASHPRETTDSTVPVGNGYILIVGAKSPHVFAKSARKYARGRPETEFLEAVLSEEDRGMLARRRNTRVCITTEEARTAGPEDRSGEDGMLAPCIQLGSFNAASPEAEEEMLSWYAQWRMPALEQAPGCIAIRKMLSVAGWAKHLVLYEFTSLEARAEYPAYLKALAPEMAAWNESATAQLTHAPGSPSVAQRLWP